MIFFLLHLKRISHPLIEAMTGINIETHLIQGCLMITKLIQR